MKDFIVPSGNFFFPGDYDKLLHTIVRADGVLCQSQQFRCTFVFPPRHHHAGIQLSVGRGHLSFVFHCKYEPNSGGHNISYKVRPGFTAVILYMCILAVTYTSISTMLDGNLLSGCLGFALTVLLFLFSLWGRKKCIHQFLHFFKGKS